MSVDRAPGSWQGVSRRAWLVLLAGAVLAIVWDLHGNAEVALAAAGLALQLVEMTRPDSQ
jgi:hypothetical protein